MRTHVTMVTALCLATAVAIGGPGCSKTRGNAKAAAAAAIKVFPKDTAIVGGVNFAKVRASKLYKQFSSFLTSGEVGDTVDLLKKKCGVDPIKAIGAVVVGIDQSMDKDHMILVVAGDWDEGKIGKCFEAITGKQGHKAKVTKDGNVTEFVDTDAPDQHMFVGWLDKSTMVMLPGALGDKDKLKAVLEAKSSAHDSPDLAAMLDKVDTNATAWIAMTPQGEKIQKAMQGLNAGGPQPKGAWMNLEYESSLKLTVGVRYPADADAKAAAQKAKESLAEVKSDPTVGKILDGAKTDISQKGSDVVSTVELSEKKIDDLVSQLPRLMRKMRSHDDDDIAPPPEPSQVP